MKRAAIALAVLAALVSGAACRRPARGRNGGKLWILLDSDIQTLDPNKKFEFVTGTVSMNIFDSLVRYNSSMNLVPSLAESWDNPDGRTWRFHLRPGVRFHDGTPLTSRDVVFTFDRIRHDPTSEFLPFLTGIVSTRALDPRTVEITTDRERDVLTRVAFIGILPAERVSREGESFFQHPVGSGPYRFVARRPNETVLAAFPGYWGGAPAVPTVVFHASSTSPRDWELADTLTPVIVMDAPRKGWMERAARGDRRLRLIARPGLTVAYLECGIAPATDNPLARPKVREAIWRALDIPRLVSDGLDGRGYPASQLVPPDVIGFNPALSVPAPDPSAARRLLAEAGYPRGIDLVLDESAGPIPKFDNVLTAQLAAAGIRVTIRQWPDAELAKRINDGTSLLHFAGWSCTSGDFAEILETSYHTRSARTELGRDNTIGYSNPELDRLIEQIAATPGPAERVGLEQKAMAIAMRDLPRIPLFIGEDRYALSPSVSWQPRVDGQIWLPEVRLR